MQISLCSLWNLNSVKRWAWVGDVLCGLVCHSKMVLCGTTQPRQKLVSATSYWSVTLITGVQITYNFCQIPGHIVRSDGGGMVHSLDTGQELKERPGYRDLLTIQYLSPLAPQIHHTRTDWAKESVFSPFNPPVSRIDALTGKVSHAGILTACPSHTPMSTHLKNSLLYISAFLKAWTML